MTKMLLPVPYSDHLEIVPDDEPLVITQIVDVMQDILRQNAKQRGYRTRDVHVKSHGCVQAVFEVLDDLPSEFRQGLFEVSAKYPAIVRFSNTNPFSHWDLIPDGRGLAIQVREVPGEFIDGDQLVSTQDFLMANHPTFMAPDAKSYLELQKTRLKAGTAGFWSSFREATRAFSSLTKWQRQSITSAWKLALQFPRHPAAYTYYSMVPIRFGHYVCKYRVQPGPTANAAYLISALWNRNAMRSAFGQSLHQRGIVLEFQIQLCVEESVMPIENATAHWSETLSPFRTIAKIHIPPQDVALSTFSNRQLSFNVWHALHAHRPLGGINRTRCYAYPASARWRAQEPQDVK